MSTDFTLSLAANYLEIEMMTDDGEDHVIMALLEEWYADAFPLMLNLAGLHGLICYDPQRARVHVPTPRRLKTAV